MNTDLTPDIVKHDKYFGCQLITFSTSYQINNYKAIAQYWFIAKNKDGKYGIVGGGNNNIGSFIGWCTGFTSWCFNPINLEDYVWSSENNAFIHKNYTFLQKIPISHGKHYYYEKDSNDEIIKFFRSKGFLEKDLLWKK